MRKRLKRPPLVSLIACGKKKHATSRPVPAEKLYAGQSFRFRAQWSRRFADQWFILSAKHGLLHPERMIERYDLTLSDLSDAERASWAEEVASSLVRKVFTGSRIIFHAGRDYRLLVIPLLEERGFKCDVFAEGVDLLSQYTLYAQALNVDHRKPRGLFR